MTQATGTARTGTGKYEALLERCRSLEPVPTAVAHPCEHSALAAAVEAGTEGLITPILVGPAATIQALAAKHGIDLANVRIVDAPHSHAAAAKAVALVRAGEAELLMKGSLHTDELLSAVVAKETGLRSGRRISHVFVMDVPTYHKVLIVTDAAINIAPALEDKADICQNAIDLAISFGVKQPKVAILAAVETVTSKMPATIDAAALCKMADRGQIKGGLLDGPLAFDNAISKDAARVKGIVSEVAGDPDILLAPDLEAGNMLAKQLSFLANADSAGLVLGARVPIILTSRADTRALEDRELRGRRHRRPRPPPGRGRHRPRHGSGVMDDFALVLNAGSSSLKFCVYRRRPDGDPWRLEARGQVDGIGTTPRFSVKGDTGERLVDTQLDASVRDGRAALDALASWLRERYGGSRVLGVGHRVVHGGPSFAGPTIVTPQVLEALRTLTPLAPLHQPHNLAAIDAVAERLPDVPQVACFDTSFHRGQPAVAQLVPLPRAVVGDGVQRYGFHGLSYEYIASVLPHTAPEIAGGRVIVAHLGSGASLCAMKDGKSVDSTLGFTALDGLCMGTRPGSLDPGVVLYLFQGLGLSAAEVETLLYKKSGLLAISGISNDMRDLIVNTRPEAKLAVDYFVYRVAREIGALTAVLGGLDGLVFTAGIGENSPAIRQRICEASAWLGVELDPDANAAHATRISRASSPVSAWVVPTNEELMIARHTGRLLGLVDVQSRRAAQ